MFFSYAGWNDLGLDDHTPIKMVVNAQSVLHLYIRRGVTVHGLLYKIPFHSLDKRSDRLK